jgi:hypothetical protein
MATEKSFRGTQQKAGRDPLASLCDELRAYLEHRRDRICAELGDHPRPVAACDVHFNRLLEERAAVYRELDRLDALRAPEGGRAAAPVGSIEDFVLSSSCIDDEARRKFRSLLDSARPARAGRP